MHFREGLARLTLGSLVCCTGLPRQIAYKICSSNGDGEPFSWETWKVPSDILFSELVVIEKTTRDFSLAPLLDFYMSSHFCDA